MKIKSKRFWIIIACLTFTMAVGIIAVINKMETLAVTCVTMVMIEGIGYVTGESYKPSKND